MEITSFENKTKIVKKIIAREGLILLAFTLAPILFNLAKPLFGLSIWDEPFVQPFLLSVLLYPLMWVIRFVIWAIGTLRHE